MYFFPAKYLQLFFALRVSSRENCWLSLESVTQAQAKQQAQVNVLRERQAALILRDIYPGDYLAQHRRPYQAGAER